MYETVSQLNHMLQPHKLDDFTETLPKKDIYIYIYVDYGQTVLNFHLTKPPHDFIFPLPCYYVWKVSQSRDLHGWQLTLKLVSTGTLSYFINHGPSFIDWQKCQGNQTKRQKGFLACYSVKV